MRSRGRFVARWAIALLVLTLFVPGSALAADPVPAFDEASRLEPSAEPSGEPSSDPATEPLVGGPAASDPAEPATEAAAAATTAIVVTTPDPTFIVNWTRTLTATISPAPDGGAVEWWVDGVLRETDPLAPGQESTVFHAHATSPGSLSVVAAFIGTDAFESSTSEPLVLDAVTQSIVIASDLDPAPIGADVTFTATVTPDPGAGVVTWGFEGDQATTELDDSGVATFVHSFTSGGQKYITATFTGNDLYPGRNADPYYQDVTWDEMIFEVTGASPTAAGPVTVVASVVPNPGGGSVRFQRQTWGSWSDPLPLGPDGSIELGLGTLSPSTYTYEFEYTGHGTYGAATDTLTFTVWNATETALSTNRTSAVKGELPVVLTASVTSSPWEFDGGSVVFDDVVGGVHVQLGPIAVTNANPVATFSSSSLRVGTHTIRATFSGLGEFMPSTSDPVTVVVAADKSVNATFSASPSYFYPYKDGFRDTVKLGGTLNEKATVTIRVYNSAGSLKRAFSLGTRAAGAYSATWNGRTSSGAALPAGKYRVTASLKDAVGNTRWLTVYANLSWRKATWKSVTVVRYGDQLSYYVDAAEQGAIYYSPDYSRGRTLDSGEMIRDCADCGLAFGEATFTLASAGLEYRYLYLEVHGHGYLDREHTGTLYLVNPTSGLFGAQMTLPETEEAGTTYGMSVSKGYISSTKRLKAVVWMTQAWGDAFDLHYLRLRYQYAVLI